MLCMNIPARHRAYLAFIFLIQTETIQPFENSSDRNEFFNYHLSMIDALADNLSPAVTEYDLRTNSQILIPVARIHLFNLLRKEETLHGRSDEEIHDAIDEFDVADVADLLRPIAIEIIHLKPTLELVQVAVDWDEESIDQELNELVDNESP